MNSLVSVIIPTYKRIDALKRALESVLNQTYDSFEIIVIDDDKDDDLDLLNMIKEFNDPRILYSKNLRTKGGNGARNTGIIKSKGYYVAFLDDDDEWLPQKLENQINNSRLKNENCAGIFGSYQIESKKKWKTKSNDGLEAISLGNVISAEVSFGSSSNLLVKRDVFKKVGMWDEELLRQQDLELMTRITSRFGFIYDKKIAVKIYGHNTPNPLKAFQEREKYLMKISPYMQNLTKTERKRFLSDHYRRQVLYLIRLKKFNEAKKYWIEAKNNISIDIKKDIKIVLNYMKNRI